MADFTIRTAGDPAAEDFADDSATYVIRVGGKDVYRVNLCRRQRTVLPSRFETCVAGIHSFEIEQTSTVGRRKIDVREGATGARIGELRGLKLYFDRPNQIVGLHDPTPQLQRLVGNALRGGPVRFIFRRAIDRLAIGWIDLPPANPLPWPGRILSRLKLLRQVAQNPFWQGQLTSTDLDFRPFAAMAVVLHSDRTRGDAPTLSN